MKARNNPSNGSFSFKDPLKKLSSGVSVSYLLNIKNFSEFISLANVIRNRLLSLLPQLIPNQVLVGGGRVRWETGSHSTGAAHHRIDTHTHTHSYSHTWSELQSRVSNQGGHWNKPSQAERQPGKSTWKVPSSNPKLFYPAVAPPFHWSSVDGT